MFIISKHSALSSTRQDVFLILTASAAVPPRTQSAAQLPSLAPHDSKARLQDVTKRRDSWRSHVHRARLRSACSYSSCKLPMGGVKGQGPLRSLGGTRGIFSHVREYPPYFGQRHRRCPPRTFVQKIKKRRLFQPSLLYLHYCKTFLLPWVAFMRSSLLRIVLRMRRDLRRDLEQLVVGEELEALLQAHLLGRDETQRVVRAGSAHVRQLLLLAHVDRDVLLLGATDRRPCPRTHRRPRR